VQDLGFNPTTAKTKKNERKQKKQGRDIHTWKNTYTKILSKN
jgi:hypothetical protein